MQCPTAPFSPPPPAPGPLACDFWWSRSAQQLHGAPGAHGRGGTTGHLLRPGEPLKVTAPDTITMVQGREFFKVWALAMSGEKNPVAQFFLATGLATRPTHLKNPATSPSSAITAVFGDKGLSTPYCLAKYRNLHYNARFCCILCLWLPHLYLLVPSKAWDQQDLTGVPGVRLARLQQATITGHARA